MPTTTTIDDRGGAPWEGAPRASDPWPDAADVLVLGAGVAGISIALGLAERGASVVVVDPDDPREGASGRAAGLVHTGLSEHPARLREALGPVAGPAFYALARRSVALLGDLVTPADQLWFATDDREEGLLDTSVAALAAFGFDARRVGADTLAERGLAGTRPGFVLAGDGLVEPRRALDVLLARARAAGARFCRGRASAVREDAAGLVAIVGEHRLRAEVVVYAAGPGAAALDPFFGDKIWPVREQALRITAALPVMAGRAGYGWTWFRPMPGGTLVGGCRWATPHLEVGETEPVPTEQVQGRIEAFARRHVSADAPIDARWAWIETHSCDGLPIVGPLPGQVRRIACTAFCGNDWGLGPACAALVVDGLLGGPAETPSMFAASRFVA